ncbi:DUF5808 domain-containing protein [Clostridium cellulovorans]|uniref:DUF5808 domain-containing protein n=1 Tax=Clostridium cellulovorans (strain ATCC 35296 / DSM 3052 / OCM 3 / 743B) TaxID=573061 RepID=D9SPM3_CLOC7|nr:DUF5808 domain-containing protein [Clostridium cellulovorans]ADL50072.1 hypothetical protein Clocel_0291 [Clostridium cellulovorans 743B]
MDGSMIFISIFSIVIFSIFYAIGSYINALSNKGIFFGVRMPLGYEKHENLLALKKDYTKRFNISFLIFVLVYAITIFLFKDYVFSTFFIAIFALLLLIHNNFYTIHKKVRQIKKEEVWKFESRKVVVVDLKGRKNTSENKTLSKGLYFILAAIVLVSFIIAFREDIIFLAIAQIVTTLVMLLAIYAINNTKQQLNGGEANELIEKNKRYKYYISLLMYIASLAVTLSFFFVILASADFISSPVIFISIIATTFIPMIIIVIGALLIGQGGKNLSVNSVNDEDKLIIDRDDDENYVLGCFYYNKNDPAVFVPKRIGIGTDLNYAKPGSKIFIGIVLAILIGSLISTFSLSHLVSTGVKEKSITIEANELSIEGMYGIKIPYESIYSIEMMETFPQDMTRKNGLAINHTLIGKFKSKAYDNCNLYIMDSRKPNLFIYTKEEKRIFINYENPDRTRELYDKIIEKIHNN